jgi:hypothetical protein
MLAPFGEFDFRSGGRKGEASGVYKERKRRIDPAEAMVLEAEWDI